VPRVRLLVDDGDRSVASSLLLGAMRDERFARWFDARVLAPGEDGLAAMEDDDASALLRLPPGLGDDLLAGRPVRLSLVRNPAQGLLPEIAEQTLTVGADLLDGAARLLREPLAGIEEARRGHALGDEEAARIGMAIRSLFAAADGLLLPPAIEVERSVETGEAGDGPPSSRTLFLFILPGVAVWALFMIGDLSMRDILVETRNGTLRRQLCAPMTPARLVLAKSLSTAAVSSIGLLVIAAVAALFADRAVDPIGFVVLSAAVILGVTGFGATVYGLATTPRQGATVSSIVLLVFAFVGGSFVPTSSMPPALRSLAPLSPFSWAAEGYRELIRNGAGVAAVLPDAAVVAAFGALLMLLGARLLARKVERGAA